MFHIINRRINRVVADIHKILLRNSLVQHVLDSHGIFGMPQLAGATFGPACSVDNSVSGDSSGSVFDWSVWFAAPKSKVSPSRKKQKHGRYFPEKVLWSQCTRCGEPKLPHRLCKENLEICAMREEDWEEHKTKISKGDL